MDLLNPTGNPLTDLLIGVFIALVAAFVWFHCSNQLRLW